jgi:hypothetical protein
MGVLTFGGLPRKTPSFIFKPKAPTILMGVAEAMCQTPFFLLKQWPF